MLNVSKGDKVILKGFTGIKLGVFEVAKATEKTVTVYKKNGDKMIFSKKTGKQTNVEEGKEKYANSIMEDDGSYVAPRRKKSTKKTNKKAAKKAEVEEDIIENDDDIEEDEEVEEKPKKKAAKKAPKKSKKVEEPEEVEDEFEDEFEDEEE